MDLPSPELLVAGLAFTSPMCWRIFRRWNADRAIGRALETVFAEADIVHADRSHDTLELRLDFRSYHETSLCFCWRSPWGEYVRDSALKTTTGYRENPDSGFSERLTWDSTAEAVEWLQRLPSGVAPRSIRVRRNMTLQRGQTDRRVFRWEWAAFFVGVILLTMWYHEIRDAVVGRELEDYRRAIGTSPR